jgi:hypothetical protein
MEVSLDPNATQRKARLYACACCRHLWKQIDNLRSEGAVLVAEAYADGVKSKKKLRMAHVDVDSVASSYVYDIHNLVLVASMEAVPLTGLIAAITTIRNDDNPILAAHLLRDIFGNLFRPVSLDAEWLTSTVVALATGIYEERAFDRMPILADALQDAGCTNEDVLNHCRDPSLTHVRGCWVVDLLTGRK